MFLLMYKLDKITGKKRRRKKKMYIDLLVIIQVYIKYA